MSLVLSLREIEDLQRKGIGRFGVPMHEQSNFFRSFSAEGFFAAPHAYGGWNTIDQDIFPVDLEDLFNEFFAAFLAMAYLTGKHSHLRVV